MKEENGDEFDLDNSLKTVRRFRKKLRQIERLETIGRKLSSEEAYKVTTKEFIRKKLQEIIIEISRHDDSFNTTPENACTDDLEDTAESNALPPPPAQAVTSEDSTYHGDAFGQGYALLLSIEKSVENNATKPQAKVSPISTIPQPPLSTEIHEADVESPPPKKPLYDIVFSTPEKAEELHTIPVITSKTSKKEKPHSKIRKLWRQKAFDISSLEGHNDVICDVEVDSGWLVSGSRDTSIKLWDLSSYKELRNMSSHTGSVTCVRMMSEDQSDKLRQLVTSDSNELMFDISEKSHDKEVLLLSSSTDCSIKMWLLPQGYLVKSIYNYSPIMVIEYCEDVVFAGSDTGKLTAYNIVNGNQILDTMIHESAITSLKCKNNILLSTSTDGDIKLWTIRNRSGMAFDFTEAADEIKLDLKLKHHESRQVLSACFYDEKVIFGDDGMNIKVLDIKAETISKFPNHNTACGFTDALCVHSDLLLSTSYDIDTGAGSLNVRVIRNDENFPYVSSLGAEGVARLLCCDVDKSSQSPCFVTGGSELLVWKEVTATTRIINDANLEAHKKVQIKGRCISELTKEAPSSDVESDATGEEDSEGRSWWWSKSTDGDTAKKNKQEESDTDSNVSNRSHSSVGQNDQSRWWCALV